MKEFFKGRLFKTVLSVVLLISAAFGVMVFLNNKSENDVDSSGSYTYVRTVTLTKGSLENSITATGTIESTTVSNVTTTQRYEVAEVYVQVGDTVKEGDKIVRLDTSDIDEQIAEEKEKLQDDYDSALAEKDNYWNTFVKARDDYETAKSAYEVAESNFTPVKNYVAPYQEAYDEAVKDFSDKTKEFNDVAKNYTAGTAEYNAAEQAMIDAKVTMQTKKSDLDTALLTSCYTQYETAYNSAKTTYEKAESTYNTATNKFSDLNSKVAEAKENLDSGNSDKLESLYEQREECILKAKSSGVVTSLKATVGSSVTDATVATIMDTSSLQLSLSVDEYDIQNLKVGMRAVVTSDAVGKSYEAKVTQIDPTASTNNQSSGFGVTVTVTSEDIDGLLIGMNANVTIIVSTTDDVYTLPLDAIETKADGTSVIYIKNSEGEFEEVEVQVGDTSDYYAEVYGSNIKEGMVVRASANEEEATVETTSDQATNMPQGFDGGSMPGGGFNGGSMPGGGNFDGGSMPGGGFGGGN